MKTIFFLVFLSAVFTGFGQGGLIVNPLKVEFNNNKGQTTVQQITLTNTMDKPMQFKLYISDWLRDSTGGHTYMDSTTHASSASKWMTVDQNLLELQPKETKTVFVRLATPDDAGSVEKMRWAMLFIENTKEAKVEAVKGAVQTAINEVFRIGVHLYHVPPTLTNKEVKLLSLTKVDTTQQVRLVCMNGGELPLRCSSYLELTNVDDGKKSRLDPVEFPMFPGQKRIVYFKLPKDLSRGNYSILGVIDAGEDMALEAAQLSLTIK